MVESITLAAKSRKDGKIFLKGTAYGDAGKYYCLSYACGDGSGEGYVKNNTKDYTYFEGGAGYIDIGSDGHYVPDHGNTDYRFYLDEVEQSGCEAVIRWAAATTIFEEDLPSAEGDDIMGMLTMIGIGIAGIAAGIIVSQEMM